MPDFTALVRRLHYNAGTRTQCRKMEANCDAWQNPFVGAGLVSVKWQAAATDGGVLCNLSMFVFFPS